jgi:hypothetical protein
MQGPDPNFDLQGHTFEIIQLQRMGPEWLAQFAVDGIKYPAFLEPHANVADLEDESDFLHYMEGQALTYAQYLSDIREGRMN